MYNWVAVPAMELSERTVGLVITSPQRSEELGNRQLDAKPSAWVSTGHDLSCRPAPNPDRQLQSALRHPTPRCGPAFASAQFNPTEFGAPAVQSSWSRAFAALSRGLADRVPEVHYLLTTEVTRRSFDSGRRIAGCFLLSVFRSPHRSVVRGLLQSSAFVVPPPEPLVL